MNEFYVSRNIICIDLKSFFAACECIDRNLDMYKIPLIVADPDRKDGAITLAVTPYLKKLGVKSRGRVFEIPKNIKYITAKPRMSLYVKKSKEVIDVYLKYVSSDDLFAYSIDEVFIDLTDYLNFYKVNDYEVAKMILADVEKTTGLTATCGIGPNLFLAKVAMDVEAKKIKNNIAKWTFDDIPTKLWTITPLSKIWGIGSKTEEKLNIMGIKNVGELAHYSKDKLIKKMGIMGEELWYRVNGFDPTKISDFKIKPKEKSFNHSQNLYKDYYGHNIPIIIGEMCEVLTARLREDKKIANVVSFGLEYSKHHGGGFYHRQKLGASSDDTKTIVEVCLLILSKFYTDEPIRKVIITLGQIEEKNCLQLNIFEQNNEIVKKESQDKTIDEIKKKYGKNSLIKASNLLADSTARERNKKIGGHNAK